MLSAVHVLRLFESASRLNTARLRCSAQPLGPGKAADGRGAMVEVHVFSLFFLQRGFLIRLYTLSRRNAKQR